VAVRLRLRRIGKKKAPMYQIVAADSRSKRDGRFLEVVGRYEPRQHPAAVQTRDERVLHWLRHGARPTDTVRSLLRSTGLWYRWTLARNGLDDARVATELEKWQMAQGMKRQRVEQRKARRAQRRKSAASKEGEAPAAPAQT
jgi:small subunit ribosomal protein S16